MYLLSWEQKRILNLVARRLNYHRLTKERMLDGIALMYEFSATDQAVRSEIAGAYAAVKNMADGAWRDTEALIPFPVRP